MQEEWKDIIGYEGLYQVSNLGRIKRLETYHYNQFGAKIIFKEKLLNPCVQGEYYGISLFKDGKYKRKYISRLVGLHFLPLPEDSKMVIAHIDPNHKEDNSVNNLMWNIINKCRAKKIQQTNSIIKNNTPFNLLLEEVSGIYKITNIVNNKSYIGSALNISKRIYRHFAELRNNYHHSSKLQRSYNKYGEGAFTAEILKICTEPDLEFEEQEYFKLLKPELTMIPAKRRHLKTYQTWQ